MTLPSISSSSSFQRSSSDVLSTGADASVNFDNTPKSSFNWSSFGIGASVGALVMFALFFKRSK